jgi:A/G-specific adenine glycosylase
LTDQELLEKMPPLLLRWYDQNARVLPWREDPSPYRVWVSEIMLQQTRVEAVKPYFERFIQALPQVADLAQASEDQLLKLWEGLGYYNRVRNLQKGARQVMAEYGGEIPASVEELLGLSGVGEYTAGAIASIAFRVPVPAVDGNVLRVMARFLGRREDILLPQVKKKVAGELRGIIPERAGDFNQSLMELGAVVCLPVGAPRCGGCPLAPLCRAHAAGEEESLPVKGKKKARSLQEHSVFLLFCGEKVALERRPEKGLLAGLWQLPMLPGSFSQDQAAEVLAGRGLALLAPPQKGREAKHIFTHVEWHMESWKARVSQEAGGFTWVTGEELNREYPLPSAFQAYFPEIGKQGERRDPSGKKQK